ncbi:hypothetical protein IMSAGC009_00703 [Lachnospiraceae bacterium]|nr:hypothetical protein IMSAGC009_00703 [Lachnospiraceae bacterium]
MLFLSIYSVSRRETVIYNKIAEWGCGYAAHAAPAQKYIKHKSGVEMRTEL